MKKSRKQSPRKQAKRRSGDSAARKTHPKSRSNGGIARKARPKSASSRDIALKTRPLPRSPGEAQGGGTRSSPPQSQPADANIAARILAAVRRIPRGKVCTYGDVAEVAGLPRRARLVGTTLRQSPASRDLPWFRVINAGGRISFPVGSDAYSRQRKKLEAEGVLFLGGRVDLRKYGWPAREEQLDELLWKLP